MHVRTADFAVLNAAQLITVGEGRDGPKRGPEQGHLDVIVNGAVAALDGRIVGIGTTGRICTEFDLTAATIIDATNQIVMPGLVDSHTHPLFAGTREDEFAEILGGLERAEAAARGGGGWWTTLVTRAASTADLKAQLRTYLGDMLRTGTTAVEAKSGYGQTTAEELRHLEIIRDVSDQTPMHVVPTFLGAHLVPKEHSSAESYVTEVIDEMLPSVADQGIAKYCDTACGKQFTPEMATRIARRATDLGMENRLHVERDDGWRAAAYIEAASADHLTTTSLVEVDDVGASGTIATVLPASEVYYMLNARAPVRGLIDAGVAVSIATDFCSSIDVRSLFSLISFSAPWYRITPEEVINAVTINPAYSIGMGKDIGSLQKGKRADLIVVDLPSYRRLIWEVPGVPRVTAVVIGGQIVSSPTGEDVGAHQAVSPR